MSTITADPTSAGVPERSPRPQTKAAVNPLFTILKPIASLQLTVTLFALSMVLVFFGTVAMMSLGLWAVVDDYFRSFIVWIPLDLVRKFGTVFFEFPKDGTPWTGSIPFPAGWTIGTALLVNLLAAHLVRFKLAWNRTGIIVLHSGMVLLMVGELITGLFAVESTMTLAVNESTDFVDVTRKMEIAVIDSSDRHHDTITAIPERLFSEPGRVSHPELPFDLEVLEYWPNTETRLFTSPPADGDEVFPFVQPGGVTGYAKLIKNKASVGVDAESHSDCPSVRVKALEKETGRELATHFLSLRFYPNYEGNRRLYEFPEQVVEVGGKKYTMTLRNQRVYQPYSVKLIKFEHGKYAGTEIPKDFASTVDVTNKESGDSHESVRIWMNNPLRYAGDSLFQQAVLYNDSGTILQVVRNPGRLLPYISCALVVIGMLIHFLIRLFRWLPKSNIRAAAPKPESSLPAAVPDTPVYMKVLPWAIVLVFVAWIGSKAIPPKPGDNGVDYYALGQVPIRDGGRIMPLDTLARTTLQSISGKSEVTGWESEKTMPAIRWLADVMDSPDWRTGPGAKHQVIRIDNDQLLGKLELPRRPGFYRYSLEELGPKFDALMTEFNAVQKKREEGKALDLYDSKVEDLGKKLKAYQRLAASAEMQVVPPQSADGDWSDLREVDRRVLQTSKPTDEQIEKIHQSIDQALESFVESRLTELQKMSREDAIKLVSAKREELTNRELFAFVRERRASASPAAAAFGDLLAAARNGDRTKFDPALATYREKYLTHVPADDVRDAKIEAHALDHFAPFYYSAFLYLFVIVFALAGWLVFKGPIRKTALLLAVFTFALHTAALITRMAVMGRPPVTNLYSSAVFIGWGSVALCLILERIYRNGVGVVVAGAVGAATMYLAQFLGGSGDTMNMLVAVLDTNFWLAVHVTTVTIGYTATFVAGAIAVMWIARMLLAVMARGFTSGAGTAPGDYFWFIWSALGLASVITGAVIATTYTLESFERIAPTFATLINIATAVGAFGLAGALIVLRFTAPSSASRDQSILVRWVRENGLDQEAAKTLTTMTYGVLCFATLMSFFGTVAGGIWADYSWGRFWGWDPKENGAVLIVIWNALVLHARWSGLAKSRGVAVLAVFGNVITAWSWFGTNQLQIGLHSYGFDNRLASGCLWFWISQLGVMVLGFVPSRYWK